MNKNESVKALSVVLLLMLSGIGGIIPITPVQAALPLDPTTIPKYVTPLVAVIPVYTPTNVIVNGTVVEQQYIVDVTQFTEQILPTGFPTTTVWGYGGLAHFPDGTPIGYFRNSPSATFNATRGIPSKITWVNNLLGVNYTIPVDPTLMWANPRGINQANVMAEAMAGLAPPFPPGYNGTSILVGAVTTNPNAYNANSPVPIVTHVHGAEVQSGSDGDPNEWFTAGGLHGSDYYTYEPTANNSAVYYYPNGQNEATIWYHDHALGLTRLNVYMGMAGYYILTDPAEPLHANIPAAFSVYDVPLAIQDRSFYADGSLRFDVDAPPNPSVHPYWVPEFFGDTFMVNGKTWPYFNVSQTTYRFRLLDGCNARFLNITLVDLDAGNATVPFTVIARDQGYLRSAVTESSILMGPGMRSEILVDFTGIPAGHRIRMKNSANAPFPGGLPVVAGLTDQIMQFVVQGTVGPTYPALPATLNPTLPAGPWPTLPASTVEKHVTLVEVMGAGGPLEVLVDGQAFGSPIAQLPVEGTTETWVVANPTADAHPMHWHLVQFQLVSRQPFNDTNYLADWVALNGAPPFNHPTINIGNLDSYYTGPATGPDADEQGWLDTVTMYPGQVSTIRVRFTGQSGNPYPFDPTLDQGYVFHCHIVDHEDNEMMRPYAVIHKSQLPSLYDAVRGLNSLIYYRIYDHGTSTWTPYTVVPSGTTPSSPAVTSNGGKVYFAARSTTGTLWFNTLTLAGNTFSGWTALDGSSPSAPQLANWGSNIVLVVRGGNNLVYYNVYNTLASTWGGWQAVPGGLTSVTPGAEVIGDTLHVVVTGTGVNHDIYHASVNLLTNVATAWVPVNGASLDGPTLVKEEATNALWAVVTGTNNLVYQSRWNGVSWGPWTAIPFASTIQRPDAVILNNDIYYEVAGQDAANTIYGASMNLLTGTFSGWVPQPGSTISPPTLAR